MNNTREGRPRRRPLVAAIVGLCFGLFFLTIGFNRPSIQSMRTVDLVHLVAAGACLGAGLAGLFVHLFGRRTG